MGGVKGGLNLNTLSGEAQDYEVNLAVAMGADAVGFVFAPSPRQIAPSLARDIAKRLPPEVLTVGVFRDEIPRRVVEIVNGSPERLEILYTGPQTGSMTIDPCGDCVTSSSIDNILLGSYCGTTSSPRRTITLAPGDYQVVAKAADGADVRPFSGTWALASGTAYSDCYYIQQSPF